MEFGNAFIYRQFPLLQIRAIGAVSDESATKDDAGMLSVTVLEMEIRNAGK